MEVPGHEYNSDQWRLFIDSSKVRLKVVLLHSGKRFPSVPLAHATNMKEIYDSMKLLFGKVSMTNLFGSYLVMSRVWHCHSECKSVTTKYCCLLCEWDNRDMKNHYVKKLWPKRTLLTQGEKNVLNRPLVLPEQIYLPSFHIKLDLMKNFVKGMDKTGRGFEYVRNKFQNVTQKSRRVYL